MKNQMQSWLKVGAYTWPFLMAFVAESHRPAYDEQTDILNLMPIFIMLTVYGICLLMGAKTIATVFSVWVANGGVTIIQVIDLVPGDVPGGPSFLVAAYAVCTVSLIFVTPLLYRAYAKRFVSEPLDRRHLRT